MNFIVDNNNKILFIIYNSGIYMPYNDELIELNLRLISPIEYSIKMKKSISKNIEVYEMLSAIIINHE